MSSLHFVKKEALPTFLAWLAKDGEGVRHVLVPTKQGKAVVFAPYNEAEHEAMCFDKASVSPKFVAFPPCETLVSYKRTKDLEDLNKTTLTLDDSIVAEPTVIFGCRPCDARGFTVLDRPYLQGPHADPYYKAKRENMVVVTRACTETCSTCFCHWVGSGPIDKTGSDILMTELADAYVFAGVSEKGSALLAACPLEKADDAMLEAVKQSHADAGKSLDARQDLSKAQEALAARFDDVEFWQKQTAHCLSCGACTYICPTCYCFNITDEGDGLGEEPGKRMRTWDTCMASHFTREASGHNPRTRKALRMRNRISHKFSYYPTEWNKVFSCNGCGRCISQCPVHLDIRAIVLAAQAGHKEE